MSIRVEDFLDLGAIAEHLAAHDVEVAGPLRAELLTGGRSNLTFRIGDGRSSWVLRRPPDGVEPGSAHDMAREHTVTAALSGTAVPVARALLHCEDVTVTGAPFTVVAFVSGRTVRSQDDLAGLDDETLGRCVDALVTTLADLHAVDHVSAGLATFGRPDAYAERQLRRWSSQWAASSAGADGPSGELLAGLERSVPPQRRTSIVHGDYRIDNAIVSESARSVRAIVDWELSTIGDPAADVAMMCAYRHRSFDLALGMAAAWTSDRLPSARELVEQYQSAAGLELQDMDFHLGLAYFKLAAICRGIDHRYRTGATVGSGFDSAGAAVSGFLEAGSAALRGDW